MYHFYLNKPSEVLHGSIKMPVSATESAKIRNLESSVLFLQQEHANTLKGLHDEIRRLQKKNTELTFRVEMGGAFPAEQAILEEKVRSLEKTIESSQKHLDASSKEKDERLQTLEKLLRSQEKTFREELKTYSAKFRKCQQELSIKAETIAELQHKLHAVNLSSVRRSSDTSPMLPTPPKNGAPRIRRGSRKSIVPIDVNSASVERPLSGNCKKDFILDPTPFLLRESTSQDSVCFSAPRQTEPLPPISSKLQQQHDHDREQASSQLNATLKRIPLSRDKHAVTKPEAEVVELAIGQVQNRNTWHQAPPSKSSNLK